MKPILAFLLLLSTSVSAQSLLTETNRKTMIGLAVGVSTNSKLHVEGETVGLQLMPSPTAVLRVTTKVTNSLSLGLRIEGTQWRIRDKAERVDINMQPLGVLDFTYNLGSCVLTASPFARFTLGTGKTRWLVGAFAGYTRSLGNERSMQGKLPKLDFYFEDGSGFTGGIEGGLRRQLSYYFSLEVLAAAQYGTINPQKWSDQVSLFAFPLTIGLTTQL
jgi:hypothetical protein